MKFPRPVLSPISRPGWRTLVGVLAGMSVLFVCLGRSAPPGSEVVCLVVGVLIIMFGAHFDQRARTVRLARELAAHGYEACGSELLDPAVALVASAMQPLALPERDQRMLVTGEHRGRTVWIALYQVQVGRWAVPMAFVAVQTVRV